MARRRGGRRGAATRQPLLVYYNLGRRYRPPAVLLIVAGLLLFLPSFIMELENEQVSPDALAGVAVVLILVGIAFWLFTTLAMKRAYVQANPDLLVIRTPFYRTLVSYRRLGTAQPIRVVDVFPRDTLKGMGKSLMKPLLPMTGVEVPVKSWPVPPNRLRRFMSPYLFSTRQEGWVFIVPDYAALIRQIDAAIHQKVDRDRGMSTSYEDPITRLKYYDNQ